MGRRVCMLVGGVGAVLSSLPLLMPYIYWSFRILEKDKFYCLYFMLLSNFQLHDVLKG